MVWLLRWGLKWAVSWRRTIEGRKSSGVLQIFGLEVDFEKVQWMSKESHEKNNTTCLHFQAFLIWVITMATNVFINNQQPQPPTLVAVHSNQWSTGICDCCSDLDVCKSVSLQPHFVVFHYDCVFAFLWCMQIVTFETLSYRTLFQVALPAGVFPASPAAPCLRLERTSVSPCWIWCSAPNHALPPCLCPWELLCAAAMESRWV